MIIFTVTCSVFAE